MAGAPSRLLLCAVYLAAGVAHLARPEVFLAIMPDWVPWPRLVVFATGLAEIAGALALHAPSLRRAAGLALAAYAVCVFPANLKHAFEGVEVAGVALDWRYHAPRLALQPLLVFWALAAGGVLTAAEAARIGPGRHPPAAGADSRQ
jgi:uncharacterized membrane protein